MMNFGGSTQPLFKKASVTISAPKSRGVWARLGQHSASGIFPMRTISNCILADGVVTQYQMLIINYDCWGLWGKAVKRLCSCSMERNIKVVSGNHSSTTDLFSIHTMVNQVLTTTILRIHAFGRFSRTWRRKRCGCTLRLKGCERTTAKHVMHFPQQNRRHDPMAGPYRMQPHSFTPGLHGNF